MKKKIKITFHANMSDDIIKFIMITLEKEFDVRRVCVSEDYDYYFAQELIYSSKKSMLKFLQCKKSAIKIIICMEDIYPDFNLFDYAIMLHKHYLQLDDRVLYLPFTDILQVGSLKTPDYSLDQTEICNNDIEKFYQYFYRIFKQDKEKVARRPEGTWPDIMYPHFMKTVCKPTGIIHVIFRCLVRVKGYMRNRVFRV